MSSEPPDSPASGKGTPRASRRSLSTERARELSRFSWAGTTLDERRRRTLAGRAKAGAAALRALDELSQHDAGEAEGGAS